jgi:hypothetical protein
LGRVISSRVSGPGHSLSTGTGTQQQRIISSCSTAENPTINQQPGSVVAGTTSIRIAAACARARALLYCTVPARGSSPLRLDPQQALPDGATRLCLHLATSPRSCSMRAQQHLFISCLTVQLVRYSTPTRSYAPRSFKYIRNKKKTRSVFFRLHIKQKKQVMLLFLWYYTKL